MSVIDLFNFADYPHIWGFMFDWDCHELCHSGDLTFPKGMLVYNIRLALVVLIDC